jgi:hypothetical protein
MPAQETPAPAGLPVDGSLAEQWEAVLERVLARSKVTHAHLRESWAIDVDDARLVVGFEKAFHAEELQKRPIHIERITGVLEEVFGRKLRLDPEVRPGETPGASAGSSDGSGSSPEESPEDLVRKALGAEVVEEVGKS